MHLLDNTRTRRRIRQIRRQRNGLTAARLQVGGGRG
jgi:hypothetical protein